MGLNQGLNAHQHTHEKNHHHHMNYFNLDSLKFVLCKYYL
jgi:hypothetical protein